MLIGVLSDSDDHSVACNHTEADADERMMQYIDMEDPDTIVDLCHHDCGAATEYEFFWDECGKVFNEDIGAVVEDRCRGA